MWITNGCYIAPWVRVTHKNGYFVMYNDSSPTALGGILLGSISSSVCEVWYAPFTMIAETDFLHMKDWHNTATEYACILFNIYLLGRYKKRARIKYPLGVKAYSDNVSVVEIIVNRRAKSLAMKVLADCMYDLCREYDIIITAHWITGGKLSDGAERDENHLSDGLSRLDFDVKANRIKMVSELNSAPEKWLPHMADAKYDTTNWPQQHLREMWIGLTKRNASVIARVIYIYAIVLQT